MFWCNDASLMSCCSLVWPLPRKSMMTWPYLTLPLPTMSFHLPLRYTHLPHPRLLPPLVPLAKVLWRRLSQHSLAVLLRTLRLARRCIYGPVVSSRGQTRQIGQSGQCICCVIVLLIRIKKSVERTVIDSLQCGGTWCTRLLPQSAGFCIGYLGHGLA